MGGGVWRIAPEKRTEGMGTPGMIREEAVATDRMWAGLVRTGAGMVSGWHHHGDYESTIYVLSGPLRMEFGLAGSNVLEARPEDFLYVAPGGDPPGEQPDRPGVKDRGGAVGIGRAGHQRGGAGSSAEPRSIPFLNIVRPRPTHRAARPVARSCRPGEPTLPLPPRRGDVPPRHSDRMTGSGG